MSLRCHHINGRAKIKITRSDCTIAKGNITIHLALNKKQLDFHDKVKQVLKLRRDTKLSLADKLFRRMIVVMDTKGVLKQRTKLIQNTPSMVPSLPLDMWRLELCLIIWSSTFPSLPMPVPWTSWTRGTTSIPVKTVKYSSSTGSSYSESEKAMGCSRPRKKNLVMQNRPEPRLTS